MLLHQYDTIVSLYKHHLDLVLKVNVFIYAVTGAILSFYLSQPLNGLVKYALIFPSVMNGAYSSFFFVAASHIQAFDIDMRAINQSLGLISYPDVMFLKKALQISALLYLLIAIGLILITIIRCT